MKFLTERQKAISEAHAALQNAHANQDRQAYIAAIALEEEAKQKPDLYHCVHCGKEWSGEGRVTIAYVRMFEMDDEHKGFIDHEIHERGSEHAVTWCSDCKSKVFEHTRKR